MALNRDKVHKTKPKVKEYNTNLRKSIKFISKGAVKSVFPAISETVADNKDIVKNANQFIRKDRGSQKQIRTTIKSSEVYQDIKSIKKRMMEDLKSGTFYDKEDTGGEFDFDSFFGIDDANDVTQTNEVVSSDATTMSDIANKAVSSNFGTTNYSTNTNNTAAMIDANLSIHTSDITLRVKQHTELMTGIQNLTKLNESTVRFNEDVMKDHIEKSHLFYQTVSDKLTDLVGLTEESVKMQRNTYKDTDYSMSKVTKAYGTDMSDFLTGMNSIDFKAYGEMINKNIKAMKSAGSGAGSQMLKAMQTGNPWSVIGTLMTSNLMPKSMKDIGKLDSAMSGMFSAFIMQMNSWKGSSNTIISKLGNILGSDSGPISANPNLAIYRDMEIDKDLKLRQAKAITEVIPEYLSKILASVSGGVDTVYNYKTGKFMTRSSAQRTAIDMRRESTNLQTMGMRNKLKGAYQMSGVMNSANEDMLMNDMQLMLDDIIRSGKMYNPKKAGTGMARKLQGGNDSLRLFNEVWLAASRVNGLEMYRDLFESYNKLKKSSKMADIQLQQSGMQVAFNDINEMFGIRSGATNNSQVKSSNNGNHGSTISKSNASAGAIVASKLNIPDNIREELGKKILEAEYGDLVNTYNQASRLAQKESKSSKRNSGPKSISEIAQKLKSAPSAMINNVFFGLDRTVHRIIYGNDDEDGNSMIAKVTDSLKGSIENMTDYFNKKVVDKFSKSFNSIDNGEFAKKIQSRLPKSLAHALQGGAAGLLVGNPLLGAMAAGAISFAGESTRVQEYLFGKMDKDGRMDNGVIPEDLQKYYKKYAPKAFRGAAVGGLASTILPGGVVTGALVGSIGSLIAETDSVKNLLFGEEGPDGKRKGGLTGRFKDFLDAALGVPIKGQLKKYKDSVRKWMIDSISSPLKEGAKPIRRAFEIIGKNMKDSVDNRVNVFREIFRNSKGETIGDVWRQKIIDPIGNITNKILSGIGRGIGKVISSPIKLITSLATAYVGAYDQQNITTGYSVPQGQFGQFNAMNMANAKVSSMLRNSDAGALMGNQSNVWQRRPLNLQMFSDKKEKTKLSANENIERTANSVTDTHSELEKLNKNFKDMIGDNLQAVGWNVEYIRNILVDKFGKPKKKPNGKKGIVGSPVKAINNITKFFTNLGQSFKKNGILGLFTSGIGAIAGGAGNILLGQERIDKIMNNRVFRFMRKRKEKNNEGGGLLDRLFSGFSEKRAHNKAIRLEKKRERELRRARQRVEREERRSARSGGLGLFGRLSLMMDARAQRRANKISGSSFSLTNWLGSLMQGRADRKAANAGSMNFLQRFAYGRTQKLLNKEWGSGGPGLLAGLAGLFSRGDKSPKLKGPGLFSGLFNRKMGGATPVYVVGGQLGTPKGIPTKFRGMVSSQIGKIKNLVFDPTSGSDDTLDKIEEGLKKAKTPEELAARQTEMQYQQTRATAEMAENLSGSKKKKKKGLFGWLADKFGGIATSLIGPLLGIGGGVALIASLVGGGELKDVMGQIFPDYQKEGVMTKNQARLAKFVTNRAIKTAKPIVQGGKMAWSGAKAVGGVGKKLAVKASKTYVGTAVGVGALELGSKLSGSKAGRIIKEGLEKIMKSKLIAKFGKEAGEGIVKKILAKLMPKILKTGVKAVGKIAGKILAAPVFAIWDTATGFVEARNIFKVGKNTKITFAMRASAALGKLISGFTLNIIPASFIAELIYKVMAGPDQEAMLAEGQAAQRDAYEEYVAETGEDISFEQYNNKMNKTVFGHIASGAKAIGKGVVAVGKGVWSAGKWVGGKAVEATQALASPALQFMKKWAEPYVKILTPVGEFFTNVKKKGFFGAIDDAKQSIKQQGGIIPAMYNGLIKPLLQSLWELPGDIGRYFFDSIKGLAGVFGLSWDKEDSDKMYENLEKNHPRAGNKRNTGGPHGNGRGLTGRGYISQVNSKWKDVPFGTYNGKQDTLGKGGCAPAVATMALNKIGLKKANMLGAANFAMAGGYKRPNSGTVPSFFPSYANTLGGTFVPIDTSAPDEPMMALAKGKPVVMLGQNVTGDRVPFGYGGGHYVLATGVDKQGMVTIQDPLNSANNNKKYDINTLLDNVSTGYVPSREKGSYQAPIGFLSGRNSFTDILESSSIGRMVGTAKSAITKAGANYKATGDARQSGRLDLNTVLGGITSAMKGALGFGLDYGDSKSAPSSGYSLGGAVTNGNYYGNGSSVVMADGSPAIMHPELMLRLTRLAGDLGTTIYLNSAYRSDAEQEAIRWQKSKELGIPYNSSALNKYAALPGTSRHNAGWAVDVNRKNNRIRNMTSTDLAKYGLHKPMLDKYNIEDWHVEPSMTKGWSTQNLINTYGVPGNYTEKQREAYKAKFGKYPDEYGGVGGLKRAFRGSTLGGLARMGADIAERIKSQKSGYTANNNGLSGRGSTGNITPKLQGAQYATKTREIVNGSLVKLQKVASSSSGNGVSEALLEAINVIISLLADIKDASISGANASISIANKGGTTSPPSMVITDNANNSLMHDPNPKGSVMNNIATGFV